MGRLSVLLALVACGPSAPPLEPEVGSAPVDGSSAEGSAIETGSGAVGGEKPSGEVRKVADPVAEERPVEACGEAAEAALQTALATAESRGVAAEYLAGCGGERLRCAEERDRVEAGDRCQVIAYRDPTRWEIVIVPQPTTGAPTRIEIWVDEGRAEAGRVQIQGSTWGVVDGVRIEGRGEFASHMHGGKSARIGGARFEVENRREDPVELRLVEARWLRAHDCELPREVQATPKVAGLAIGDGLIEGERRVTIPAGARESVQIGHALQRAYMVSCDRFATSAIFEVDGERVEVVGEHRVVRRSPLRR